MVNGSQIWGYRTVEIKLLGSLFLSQDDKEYTMSSKRASVVLTLLALSPGTPVPFDHLVDELWAEQPMANSRNALQANVVRLRRMLHTVTGGKGSETLRTVCNGYLLDIRRDNVDALSFLDLADAGARLATHDPEKAARTLESALSLWRGPALMDACDGLRCRSKAAHLEDRWIAAYEDLIAAKLSFDPSRVSVPELRQLASEYATRERLSELLMLALYQDGRQTEALDVFHGVRRHLADDFGVEPGRGLHRVYQAILQQDKVLGEPRWGLSYAGQAS